MSGRSPSLPTYRELDNEEKVEIISLFVAGKKKRFVRMYESFVRLCGCLLLYIGACSNIDVKSHSNHLM